MWKKTDQIAGVYNLGRLARAGEYWITNEGTLLWRYVEHIDIDKSAQKFEIQTIVCAVFVSNNIANRDNVKYILFICDLWSPRRWH